MQSSLLTVISYGLVVTGSGLSQIQTGWIKLRKCRVRFRKLITEMRIYTFFRQGKVVLVIRESKMSQQQCMGNCRLKNYFHFSQEFCEQHNISIFLSRARSPPQHHMSASPKYKVKSNVICSQCFFMRCIENVEVLNTRRFSFHILCLSILISWRFKIKIFSSISW